MQKKNIQQPPKEPLTFQDLFKLIWWQGIGNHLNTQGDPIPWNDESFQHISETFGLKASKSAYEKWKSGKSTISPKNSMILAKVLAGNDPILTQLWRVEIYKSCMIQRKKKKETLSEKLTLAPSISSMKVCTQSCFDDHARYCTENKSNFPMGTKKIIVSFIFENMTTGKKFQRKWYRNGKKFLERNDVFDSAWPGYTYIENWKGHPQGLYILRIMVDGNLLKTAEFTVGSEEPNKKYFLGFKL